MFSAIKSFFKKRKSIANKSTPKGMSKVIVVEFKKDKIYKSVKYVKRDNL